MQDKYYVLKLKTGETLFAEITEIIGNESLTIENPWIVREDGETGQLFSSKWVPYTDNITQTLHIDMVYVLQPLNSKFTRFYGSMMLQTEINELKEEISSNLNDRKDYHALSIGVNRMKEIVKSYQEKFGLEEDIIDFSKFETALENYKPTLH
jgi:FtsZ-binding cell division protein ZapB